MRGRRQVAWTVGLLVLAGGAVAWWLREPSMPAGVETATVQRGTLADVATFRSEVKAHRSVGIVAPSGVGDLQIVSIARNGSEVKKGELVVRFDATLVVRSLAEKRSALRQVEAETAQARAAARITEEQVRTDRLRGEFDIERARLDVGTGEVIARTEAEKARLALDDAQQRARETEARLVALRAGTRARLAELEHRRAKARADLAREEVALAAMEVRAPLDGLMVIGRNYRASPFGDREWRAGDRAWAGALLAELPDVATPYVLAKIDEIDRGRLEVGQSAIVTVEAVQGTEFRARVTEFSTLAKPDFTSWPPPRLFDMHVALDTDDRRLRPGMTAAIRVPLDPIPDTLLVPIRAIHQDASGPYAFVWTSHGFERRTLTVTRRTAEQAAVASGIVEGDRVALGDPRPEEERK